MRNIKVVVPTIHAESGKRGRKDAGRGRPRLDGRRCGLRDAHQAVADGERKCSPAEVASVEVVPVMDNDPDRICTSIGERSSLSLRMGTRRCTRLTDAFSKKWGEPLGRDVALVYVLPDSQVFPGHSRDGGWDSDASLGCAGTYHSLVSANANGFPLLISDLNICGTLESAWQSCVETLNIVIGPPPYVRTHREKCTSIHVKFPKSCVNPCNLVPLKKLEQPRDACMTSVGGVSAIIVRFSNKKPHPAKATEDPETFNVPLPVIVNRVRSATVISASFRLVIE